MPWGEQDGYEPRRWMRLSQMPLETRAAVHGRTVQEQETEEARKEAQRVVQSR
jgi:hypothetical protein